MPVRWSIRGSLLVLTLDGDYTFPEMQNAVVEALTHPDYRPGTSLLIDARRSLAAPSVEEVRARARWMASLRGRGLSSRCATVSSPEAFRYGLTRMLSAYVEHAGIEMRVFSSLEEAERWLVDPETGAAPA